MSRQLIIDTLKEAIALLEAEDSVDQIDAAPEPPKATSFDMIAYVQEKMDAVFESHRLHWTRSQFTQFLMDRTPTKVVYTREDNNGLAKDLLSDAYTKVTENQRGKNSWFIAALLGGNVGVRAPDPLSEYFVVPDVRPGVSDTHAFAVKDFKRFFKTQLKFALTEAQKLPRP